MTPVNDPFDSYVVDGVIPPWVDGGRSLALWAAEQVDVDHSATDWFVLLTMIQRQCETAWKAAVENPLDDFHGPTLPVKRMEAS